jgi:hypothetical protein
MGGDMTLHPAKISLVILPVTILLTCMNTVLAQSPGGATPCLYDSQAFSEGARICVQKNLMMVCSVNDMRPQWNLVQDKELSSYCLAAIETFHRVSRISRPRVHPRQPATASFESAKCFSFNGRRFCE